MSKVSPKQLLDFAISIEKDKDPCAKRVSASTAYYSSFHLVRPIAEKLPRSENEPRSTHAKVLKRLNVSGRDTLSRQIREVHGKLNRMRTLRNKADYDIDYEFTDKDYENVMTRARVFPLHVQTLQSMMDRKQSN